MPPARGTEAEKKNAPSGEYHSGLYALILSCEHQLSHWFYSQSERWSVLLSDRLLRSPHPCLSGVQITCSMEWTLLLLFKHLWVMTRLWLSNKPLHLPVSSSSRSCNVSQHSRALECHPCPLHSICCLQNFCVPGWHTADSSVLWDRDTTIAVSHKMKQNIN